MNHERVVVAPAMKKLFPIFHSVKIRKFYREMTRKASSFTTCRPFFSAGHAMHLGKYKSEISIMQITRPQAPNEKRRHLCFISDRKIATFFDACARRDFFIYPSTFPRSSFFIYSLIIVSRFNIRFVAQSVIHLYICSKTPSLLLLLLLS